MDSGTQKKILALALVAIVIVAGVVVMTRKEAETGLSYDPDLDLAPNAIFIVDQPGRNSEMEFISCLSSIQEDTMSNNFRPVLALLDGKLEEHQVWALANTAMQGATVYLFTRDEDRASAIRPQLEQAGYTLDDANVFPMDTMELARFKGFNGIIEVGSYEESLWVAPLAAHTNRIMVMGEPTFSSQEEVIDSIIALGMQPDYVILTNPHDLDTETLEENVEAYNPYNNAYFTPALSCMSSQLAVYRDGVVITRFNPSEEAIGVMDLTQNVRAIGQYLALRNITDRYGIPEYVTIVGSYAAIPQFEFPMGEGDEAYPGANVVDSDIVYGFLDDDHHTMDAAVGRVIGLDLSAVSRNLFVTFKYDLFAENVPAEYSSVAGGPRDVQWRTHGASFSGYEITYERLQATPARWICDDFEDEGMTYDYWGPSGTGIKFLDGDVSNSKESNIFTICQASGAVAYRGHGSDYGSLYGVRVYGPNGEEARLSSEDARAMYLPPQTAFFVSCLNGKIWGHGPAYDGGDDLDYQKLFALNYLYGGAATVIGATEVSYSNIGQDITALQYKFGPMCDNPQWDKNDAWYAYVWDGILNHEDEYGSVGKAVMWAENRYIQYHNSELNMNLNPWESPVNDDADWKEIAMFAVYGDPAHEPNLGIPGANAYDPWHNGSTDQ